jgi:uncharacterized protein
MYTKEQKEIIGYARAKVLSHMGESPVGGHGVDHAIRVATWAVEIAKKEKANIFLCELAGLLHDVGRALEDIDNDGEFKKRHHELSYEICQDWFRNDEVLSSLSNEEKIILLYSIRYHWNNTADKYFEAIILRDADKLDGFGKIGIKRTEEFFNFDREKIMNNLRLREHDMFWIRTNAARSYFEKHKMFEPILKYVIKKLKEEIHPVEL